MITDEPAQLFGLRERGRLAEGYSPTSSSSTRETDHLGRRDPGARPARRQRPAHRRLAGHGARAGQRRRDVRDGKATGALPGTLLRSGRDTVSVNTH